MYVCMYVCMYVYIYIYIYITFHLTKTIENGGKSHYEIINVFLKFMLDTNWTHVGHKTLVLLEILMSKISLKYIHIHIHNFDHSMVIIVWEYFKKNYPHSSKNKLQHIQLSDTTGTSNGTGFYGQMKQNKFIFSSKHSRWVW